MKSIICPDSENIQKESFQASQKYLIVNDEPFQLMMMEQQIKFLKDVQIHTAVNGDIAVRQIQKNLSKIA